MFICWNRENQTFKIMKFQLQCAYKGFKTLGESWGSREEILKSLEEFVCKMCGDQFDNVNDLRCKILCSKRGKILCEDFPPCNSALSEHCKRTNYESKIWRPTLQHNSEVPSSVGYGCEMNLDGFEGPTLNIK